MFSTTTIQSDTISAYLETHYYVLGSLPFTLLIGEQNAELASIYKSTNTHCSAFITACNPFSEQLTDAENQERQSQLSKELDKRSLKYIDGKGQHPNGEWPAEVSFLVLGLSLEAAKKLAVQFEQNAIVWCDVDAIPQLILLK